MRQNILFHFVLFFFAGLTVKLFQSLVQHVRRIRTDCRIDVFGNMIQFHLALGFADLFLDHFDESALFFDLFMSEQDSLHHLFIRNLFRTRFHHHDGVFRARKSEA